jgi:tetratricopeptide (TPR) repeat protein
MKDEMDEIDARELVELDFLEAVAARLPEDADVLKALGDLYTRVGRYEKGLDIDGRLAKLCPRDPQVWYNLGCSLALLKKRDAALQSLKKAVTLGYDDYEWMSRDADLKSLREEHAFKSLIRKLSLCAENKQNDAENA